MNRTTLWLTGATGFVGSHLLYHVLQTSDWRVVTIVRAGRGNERDGTERVCAALRLVAASRGQTFDLECARERLTSVCGDITRPLCGVEDAALPSAASAVEFWHVAASLRFEDRHRAEIRAHNVDGTHHALALADRLDAGKFVYVSTAYTCGVKIGLIEEELHPPEGPFNNVYEQTKCEAEHAVTTWGRERGRTCVVLRPSIVVGPESTHAPGGSDTGLYGFAREMARMKPTLCAAKAELSMCGEAHAGLNLVAVDHAVAEMWSLARAAQGSHAIHHVTSDAHPNVGELMEEIATVCGIPRFTLVEARSGVASPVEEALDRRARFYASYLRAPKRFARRAGRAAAVTRADLRAYLHGFAHTATWWTGADSSGNRVVRGRPRAHHLRSGPKRTAPCSCSVTRSAFPPTSGFL